MRSIFERKRRLMALLACIFMAANLFVLLPSASAEEGEAQEALAPVYLDSSSYVEAEGIYVLPEDRGGGGRASFTLVVHNQGASELQFNDYWVRLMTRSGTSYLPQLVPQDKNKNVILPGASERFTFYAQVGRAVKEKDLMIKVFKWDFSKADFESSVGEIAIPDGGYTSAAPAHSKKRVYMAGVPVDASIKRVLLNKNEKNNLLTVYVTLDNKGDLSFELPDYRYFVRTAEGSLYPVEPGKSGKASPIHPGESKDIQLTATIPAEIDILQGWELILAQNMSVAAGSAAESLSIPLASFQLSVTPSADMPVGESVDFSTKDGIYRASFQTIQRLPWEEQDIIAAELLIQNTGSKSLPIPRLKGYFMLDDAVKVEASVVKADDLTGFSGHADIHFQALGKIAYNYKFSKVKFVLQEQDEDDATNDVAEFFYDQDFASIPVLQLHDALSSDQIGHHADYSIKEVHTYTSETSDLFIVNVEMKNLESRFVNHSKLSAFLRDSGNTIYPATVAETSKKIIPQGKGLITISAVLPKGSSKKGMQLLVGQSAKGDKLASLSDTPDSYFHVSAFELPEQEQKPESTLKQINIFPYTLTLSHFTTSVNMITEELKVSFDTELSKDLLTETSTEGHRLVVEITDEKADVTISESIDVESAAPDSGQTGGKFIKLGKGKYTLENYDKDFIEHVTFSGKYQLKLYDEYLGHKRLITSKPVSWFASLD